MAGRIILGRCAGKSAFCSRSVSFGGRKTNSEAHASATETNRQCQASTQLTIGVSGCYNRPAIGAREIPMKLTQDQIDFFTQQGYLRYGALLTDAELPAYRAEYDRVFQEANQSNAFRNLADDGKATTEKQGTKRQMLQIMQVCERSLLFAKLLYDPRILDIVEDLIGPNIMLFHDQALWKPAKTGGAVFWHQDNAYWHCRPANLLSCWLTLDDVVRENGAMQVIPGSHLAPVWHEKAKTTSVLLELKVDESKAVAVDLPAGGVMFHHCQTLHYTQPNDTDRQRRAFAIHFMTPGTRGEKGDTIPVSYHNPLLRARL